MKTNIEKKLKFNCPACLAVYQFFEIHKSTKDKCLNNCLEKWQFLLTEYCQEQIILDLTRKEQEKDGTKSQELAKWIRQIKANK